MFVFSLISANDRSYILITDPARNRNDLFFALKNRYIDLYNTDKSKKMDPGLSQIILITISHEGLLHYFFVFFFVAEPLAFPYFAASPSRKLSA